MKKIGLLIALFSLVTLNSLMAQDSDVASHKITLTIPAVSLVDIEGATDGGITMAFTAPTEAGEALGNVEANSDLWLNYSYIPATAGKTASISVSSDQTTKGFILNVTAADAGGSLSGGKLGTVVGPVTGIGASSKPLINAIGASYTGNGPSNGHNLTYNLVHDATNYGDLVAAQAIINVTYTISAD